MGRFTAMAPEARRAAVEALDRSEVNELLLQMLGQMAGPKPGVGDSTGADAKPQPEVANDVVVASAEATSCLLPRGKFDLAVTESAALRGIGSSQRFRLPVTDVAHLVAVPKGDSVKPIVLVVAQLRQAPVIEKSNGTKKPCAVAYVVMQFAKKEFEKDTFVATLSEKAGVKLGLPQPTIFRTAVTKPNQPDCAVKVRCPCESFARANAYVCVET